MKGSEDKKNSKTTVQDPEERTDIKATVSISSTSDLQTVADRPFGLDLSEERMSWKL